MNMVSNSIMHIGHNGDFNHGVCYSNHYTKRRHCATCDWQMIEKDKTRMWVDRNMLQMSPKLLALLKYL